MSKIDSYFDNYKVNEYTNFHLKSIFLAKQAGINIECYLLQPFDSLQLEQIYLGKLAGVDVDKYADIRFESEQMNEIRLGLIDGVDVDIYSSFEFSVHSMRRFRRRLIKELNLQIRCSIKSKNLVVEVEHKLDQQTIENKIQNIKNSLINHDPMSFEGILSENEDFDFFK